MIVVVTAALAMTGVQVSVPPAPPPPPVIDMSPLLRSGSRLPAEQQLLRWTASPALCRDAGAGGVRGQPMVRAPEPQRALSWVTYVRRPSLTFDFRIDASGRPLSIRRAVPAAPTYVADAQDVAPALAASRFAPGVARSGCTVTFTAVATPISTAPLAEILAFSALPSGTPNRALWQRVRLPGSTCVDPVPDVLLRAFPAFRTLPDQPGFRSWSLTGYDLDAAGKPIRLRTVASSGTPELDAAARRAVAASRFERGARVGCLYPYYKNATVLAAPEPPEEERLRPADATCPRQHDWSRAPVLSYPPAYSSRSIEGWAIVAYDVAPWGQTGNLRVLQSEPTADFGEAATQMIRSAAHKPGGGYVGCTERVLYVIRKPGMAGGAEAIVD